MSNQQELVAAIESELSRLSLDLRTFPGAGLAADAGALDDLLARLRALTPPVSWRDIFPDIPSHWIDGRPETWTTPYRPLGPFDHQSLPTGAAVHVMWPRETDSSCLDRLVNAARADGCRVHGAGWIFVRADSPTLDAMIVLEAENGGSVLDDFLEWLARRTDVALAAVPRLGTEEYIQDL